MFIDDATARLEVRRRNRSRVGCQRAPPAEITLSSMLIGVRGCYRATLPRRLIDSVSGRLFSQIVAGFPRARPFRSRWESFEFTCGNSG